MLQSQVHTVDILDILAEITIPTPGTKAATSFAQLYVHWQNIPSTQTLNKRFYQVLFHWYLWAKRHIEIPAVPKNENQDKDTLTLKKLGIPKNFRASAKT